MPKKWLTVCPVCEQSVHSDTNTNAVFDMATGEWCHSPCSRFITAIAELMSIKYEATIGRMDSSKPILSNTPKPGWEEYSADKRGFASRQRDYSDSTLCPLCFVWSNSNGPQVHKNTCSRFGVGLNKPSKVQR